MHLKDKKIEEIGIGNPKKQKKKTQIDEEHERIKKDILKGGPEAKSARDQAFQIIYEYAIKRVSELLALNEEQRISIELSSIEITIKALEEGIIYKNTPITAYQCGVIKNLTDAAREKYIRRKEITTTSLLNQKKDDNNRIILDEKEETIASDESFEYKEDGFINYTQDGNARVDQGHDGAYQKSDKKIENKQIIKIAKKVCTKEQFEMLILNKAYGKAQRLIGKKFGVDKTKVSREIKKSVLAILKQLRMRRRNEGK